jgi:hypothetical protein
LYHLWPRSGIVFRNPISTITQGYSQDGPCHNAIAISSNDMARTMIGCIDAASAQTLDNGQSVQSVRFATMKSREAEQDLNIIAMIQNYPYQALVKRLDL